MKIAIIGTGISGLTAGYYLHKAHDITLFEANNYIGGHTATKEVKLDDQSHAIDTGFIVYNDRTYPHFIKLMEEVGVSGLPTEMSFSVKNDFNGLEYNGHTLATLFAQRKNWFNPEFYAFIWDILRFNRLAKKQIAKEDQSKLTLGDFLQQHRFNHYFCENYILPMGAAIWSSTLADMRSFPLNFFLRFFLNHGLLDVVGRPQWYVIEGGSKAYIPKLTQGFVDKIRLSSPVTQVKNADHGVVLMVNGAQERFDQVIFACHSDQALALLAEPTPTEKLLLSQMPYQSNEVVLHLDESLLPTNKKAWASWNYWISKDKAHTKPRLTYNMNILQQLKSEKTFCVSLNSSDMIDDDKVLGRFNYDHPVFSLESVAAQKDKALINGQSNRWFCGAYWHNGFHEDGVKSALDVVEGITALCDKALRGKPKVMHSNQLKAEPITPCKTPEKEEMGA
jgi:predicted NAD/FAD-binding protein